jgi:hypothetical protein
MSYYGEYIIIRSRPGYETSHPVAKRVLADTSEEAARKFFAVMTGKLVKDVTTDDAYEYLIENDFRFPVLAEMIPEP